MSAMEVTGKMSEDDKRVFEKARPYVIGVLAFAIALRFGPDEFSAAFDDAETFVQEFEKRNGIKTK